MCVLVRGREGWLTRLCLHARQCELSLAGAWICMHAFTTSSLRRDWSPQDGRSTHNRTEFCITKMSCKKKNKKKTTCPSLNWHCSISGRLGILICSGILSDRRGEKKLQGQQRFTDGELAQDLCRVAFFFHWGRSMCVINRYEVNNLLSRALAIRAVVMGGAQGRKPGTLFSWSVIYGSGYAWTRWRVVWLSR